MTSRTIDLFRHQPYHKTKKSRRKSILINPWKRTLLKDSSLLFALIYWHNWLISRSVLPCTSYFTFQKKRERHLGMCLLTQNHFWLKCLQSLLMMMELHVPNVIWYNNSYHASPSLMKTCSSKDNRYDQSLYYSGYIGSTHIERIQVDLGSTLSIIPKRLLYFLGIPWAGCQPRLRSYMVSTLGVVNLSVRSISGVKLETWN